MADEGFSDQEAHRRFQKTLRAALNTPPQPIKRKPKRTEKSTDSGDDSASE